jgi:hypothetical protein
VKAVSYGPGANVKIAQLTAQNDELVDKVNSRNRHIAELRERLKQAEALHYVQLKKIAELEDDNERLINERDAAYREQTDLYQQLQSATDEPDGVDDNPYDAIESIDELNDSIYQTLADILNADQLTLDDVIGFVGDDAKKANSRPLWVCLSRDDDDRLTFDVRSKGPWSEWMGSTGFGFVCENELLGEELKDGTMILLNSDNYELRRHNPGDPMPWRDK